MTNFMTAVNPQITKSYASGDHTYMFSLVRKASRMSYYLLFILALPVIFNAEMVLDLWLKEVPEHSALFMQLFLIFALSESISRPLITSMLASGKVRDYQLVVGGIQLLNLPIAYVLLKAGYVPEITVDVSIALSVVCLFVRLWMLKRKIGFPMGEFITRVVLNVLLVTLIAVVPCIFISIYMPMSIVGFIINVCACAFIAMLSVLFVGCSKDERSQLAGAVIKRFSSK